MSNLSPPVVILTFKPKHIYQNDALDLYNVFHPTALKNIILIAEGLFMPILWNKGRLSLADETILENGVLQNHLGAPRELRSFSSPGQANGKILEKILTEPLNPLFWSKS